MKVEKRTFISKEKYDQLVAFLDQNSVKKKREYQIVNTFRSDHDFRIIVTKHYIKLNLKKNGRTSEEYNVMINPIYHQDLIGIYQNLGMVITLKRYRIRNQYIYQNLFITVDDVHKYGYVLRVMAEDQETGTKAEEALTSFLKQQAVTLLPSSEFNERFTTYRLNWPEFTKDMNDHEFLQRES